MQALHDDDDAPLGLIIKAAKQGVVVPLVDRRSSCLRKSIVGLKRVVEQDKVRSSAGKDAAHRGG
jgi:hypothetical protein